MLDKPLNSEEYDYLLSFWSTKHFARDEDFLREISDGETGLRAFLGLPYGIEGEFIIASTNQYLLTDNRGRARPPYPMPDYWCPWVPQSDRVTFRLNTITQRMNCVEWMEYLIEKFFLRWGYTLNGQVVVMNEDGTKVRIEAKANHVLVTKLQ